jgi:hypothetical protein
MSFIENCFFKFSVQNNFFGRGNASSSETAQCGTKDAGHLFQPQFLKNDHYKTYKFKRKGKLPLNYSFVLDTQTKAKAAQNLAFELLSVSRSVDTKFKKR